MNKTHIHLNAGILCSLIALSALFAACAQPASTVQIDYTPTLTYAPTDMTMPTETPPPTNAAQPSQLVFPHLTGDAGNFALLAGETITFTWENPPQGADRYEFALTPLNKDPSFVLGIDSDNSDGVAVSWTILEHVSAELRATAYFLDGQKVELYAGAVYSGGFPPAGVCSLIARHQPVEVYRLPDRTAEIFALLYPSVYAHVLETAPGSWYRIDASAAMNLDGSPASGDGWVNGDKGVLLIGPCNP